MSSDNGQKNIQSIRTFSEDVKRAKEQQKDPQAKENAEVISPIPKKAVSQKIVSSPESIKQNSSPTSSTNKFLRKKEDRPAQPKARLFVPKKRVDLSTEVASVAHTDKTSILIDTEDVFLSSSTHDGNIIRDTKRKRFRLIPAMFEATSVWLKKQKDAYEAFRHPNHPVTKAEAREKVIKAAVREDAQAPKADFKDVATRLKSAERTPITSALRFKEKSAVAAPSWTHTSEEIEQDAVDQTPLQEVLDSQQEEFVREEEDSIAETPINETPTEPNPFNTSTFVDVEPEEIVAIQTPEPEEVSIAQEVTVENEEPLTFETEPSPVLPTTQAEIPSLEYAEVQNQEQPRLLIYYFIIVIVVASLLGVGISYYWFVMRDTQAGVITIEYTIPELIQTSDQVPFRFGENRRATLEIINDFVKKAQTITQLYPVVVSEGVEKPAPAQTIINELQFQAPGSFTRSIKEITFGGAGAAKPFLVLKVTSFDIAFAGMLEWEKTMSADLSPLFGEVVINSFDPSARTDTQVREAFFKDTIASNKNVRLLLDEEGADRIVYTFKDQNTILITTTREVLDEVLQVVR